MKYNPRHKKNNSTKFFVATTILIAAIFGSYAYFGSDRNEVVVAKVNNQKIFKSDIERKLKDVFEGQGQEVKTPEIAKLPKEVLEILVKEIYLEKELTKEAKKSKVVRSKENKERINEVKARFLRQIYIDSLLKEEVSEQKINDKYAELTNNLSGKKEYHIFHIVVKEKEEAEKLSSELKAKKPAKFSDLAKKYSIDKASSEKGGDLGYILEDNLIQEISETVLDLKTNTISNPVQTKFGWHLIKVTESRDATILPFESVKDNIRDQLVQNKINEINNKITKDIKIEILLKLEEKKAESINEPAKEANETTVSEPVISENEEDLNSAEEFSSEKNANEEVVNSKKEEEVIADKLLPAAATKVKESKPKANKKTNKKDIKADKKKSAAKKTNDKNKEKKSR